jgi:hypothetical protein
MQFTGKAGIAVIVSLTLGVTAVGFGSGLLVGRQFSTHRFERFGESWYVLDATTGKVCNPLKDPNAPTNPFDQALPNNQPSGSDPFAPYGGHEVKPAPNYPPPCGK